MEARETDKEPTLRPQERKSTPDIPIVAEDILQKGSQQVTAGYILYGSSTTLVYATGYGVNGFGCEKSLITAWKNFNK